MAENRASSFLPTIKCSMCAKDIEIFLLGEHVCPGPGQVTPPPESNESFDRLPYKQTKAAGNGLAFLKPKPPRVDTSAANHHPYLPPDHLTPVSASPSRAVSPNTSAGSDGKNSPFARPARSTTAPMVRPPSPEVLSPNADSPFPKFPTTKAKPKQIKIQGGSLTTGRQDNEFMYAPVSPRTASNGGLLQRMNTIAPGPFDVNNRKNVGEPGRGGHRRQPTAASTRNEGMSPIEAGDTIVRPSTAQPGHSRTSTNSSSGSNPGMGLRFPRKNGYGGFGPPEGDQSARKGLLSPENRSQTFPLQNSAPTRRPSETAFDPQERNLPAERQDGPDDTPLLTSSVFQPKPRMQKKPSMSGPDLTRPPPPRGASIIRGDARDKIMSTVNLDAEFGAGNPYHTSSISQSSAGSGFSAQSKASSRSSPPTSTIGASRSLTPDRSSSHVVNMDVLMADLETSMSELQPQEPSKSLSPPRDRKQYPRPLQPPPKIESSFLLPSSPMEPPAQSGRLSPIPQNPSRSPSPTRDHFPRGPPPTHRAPSPDRRAPSPDRRAPSPGLGPPPTHRAPPQDRRAPSPARGPQPTQRAPPPIQRAPSPVPSTSPPRIAPPPEKRRPGTASKGNCKGCGEIIKGKSISSADGRLTGRYHKQCFVCNTCSEPFPTATFYVHRDSPYCERHYHKLNGSVCTTCDKGIEGQYLESERKQKFHPGCLACADCKRNLRHDYFEMNGRVYCERDAFRRTQQQQRFLGPGLAPTNRMERRTTRLMMM